ncbi:MAG TPA: hypothetical protein VFB63_05710 [Bryobacteraceae bacterium]|nr:hypothetical protein [Bryobacteraceae bacterium]
MIHRRAFLTACVAVGVNAHFAFAQQPGEVKRLGWLSAGTLPVVGSNPALTRAALEVAQLFDALKGYGWIEGKTSSSNAATPVVRPMSYRALPLNWLPSKLT